MLSTLRPPRPDELPRLHAFLPAPPTAAYQLATAHAAPSPERLVAATACWLADPAAPAGPGRIAFCRWRVAPRWEIEDAILPAAVLNAVLADAAAVGATILHTASLLPKHSPAADCLATSGWTISSRNEFYEGRPTDAGARLDAIYRRFAATPDGPAVLARLCAGTPTPDLFPAIRALVVGEALVSAGELVHGLDRLDQPGGWSRVGSRVLLTTGPDPALAAAVLVRLDADTATIDAQVVDAEVCARAGVSVGLANVLLLRSGLASWQQSGGGTRLRFRAHPEIHRQTANFARRCGAALVGASCAWQYRLAP